jgi:hypothetical protein
MNSQRGKRMIKKRGKLLIKGVVMPSSRDANGLAMGVSLHTPEEKQYLIQLNKLGKELLDLVHHKVEVTGKIRERLDGSKIIIISHYRRLAFDDG